MRRSSRLAVKTASNKKRRHIHNNVLCSNAAIKSLSRDLLVEVVASAASQSFIDLHNMKICCKDFLEATEDNYVWQRVSLEKFPLIEWFPNDKALSFLKRCRESENTESLYREGLREYFGYPNGNIGGLGSLKMASQKGHREAKYVYGMILLCSKDDECRKRGLEHMRSLRESKCVTICRKNVQRLSKSMWLNNGMLVRNQTPLCNSRSTCKGWRVINGRWLLLDDEDDDTSLCEYCRWDHELEFFYRLFNGH